MITRAALFVAWAVVGLLLSYGALYALTPFGLLVVGACLLFARDLPSVGGSRWPEALGLLAGPRAFCLVIAGNAHDPSGWLVGGAAIVAAALFAYALVGRALCARSA